MKKKDLKGIFEKFELGVLTKINGDIQKAREEGYKEGRSSGYRDGIHKAAHDYMGSYPLGIVYRNKQLQDAENVRMSKELAEKKPLKFEDLKVGMDVIGVSESLHYLKYKVVLLGHFEVCLWACQSSGEGEVIVDKEKFNRGIYREA